MTTLAIMKERIADELARDDLSSASEFRSVSSVSSIHEAIHTAITEYRTEKLYFMKSRNDVVFSTVANQMRYTSSDLAAIANIIKIEYGFAVIGGSPYRLTPRAPDLIEGSTLGTVNGTGQPGFYAFRQDAIWLEPIPADVYEMRFGCVLKIAAPASDSETGNKWMTDGETLIRNRAKAELYAGKLRRFDIAEQYAGMAMAALARLRDETDQKENPESATVAPYDPFGGFE